MSRIEAEIVPIVSEDWSKLVHSFIKHQKTSLADYRLKNRECRKECIRETSAHKSRAQIRVSRDCRDFRREENERANDEWYIHDHHFVISIRGNPLIVPDTFSATPSFCSRE